ncbi:MAG: hypothetical protein AVDCRST_MAG35-553, partial [uncultured Quadrisphaera sp.]
WRRGAARAGRPAGVSRGRWCGPARARARCWRAPRRLCRRRWRS